jgi:hypothetical protein
VRPERSDPGAQGACFASHRRWFGIVGGFLLLAGAVIFAFPCWNQAPSRAPAVSDAGRTDMEVAPAALKPRAAQPTTLRDLLALPRSALTNIDTATLNLLCAEGLRGSENLNVQSSLDSLDAWAKHVASETQRNFHRLLANPREYDHSLGYYRMMMLATVLQQDFGTHYNPERALPQLRGKWEPSDVFFGDSRDVFIHGLLGDKHRGTCSSLPALYAAVAQRLGYPVELVAAKGHLFVRYEEGTEHLNVEATSIGFNTYPDEHYRQWPIPMTSEEAKTFGWLRPMRRPEVLGAFLAIRAASLTSMKRFDEAAETWAAVGRYLPVSPDLKNIIARSRERARIERAADRWDDLWNEVAHLQLPFGPSFGHFRDRRLQVQLLMNQSTNLVEIQREVAALKQELEADRRQAMLMSDSIGTMPPPILATEPLAAGSESSEMVALLAAVPQPVRVRIPAERVPHEYWQGIPQELQRQLNGLSKEEEIVTEMWSFNVEGINRRNQEAVAALTPKQPEPLPPHVRREWLSAAYRDSMPKELRRRLAKVSRAELVHSEIYRFQLEEENQRRAEEMKALLVKPSEPGQPNWPLAEPPVFIEIIPPKIATP